MGWSRRWLVALAVLAPFVARRAYKQRHLLRRHAMLIFVWEFRPSPGADVAAIRARIDSFLARATPSGIAHATNLLTRVPPLAPQPDGMAADLAVTFGALLPSFAMPFGTEAGFFQEVGIPAVVCGPGSIAQAHQPDEWIEIEQVFAADQNPHDRFRAAMCRDRARLREKRGCAAGLQQGGLSS